MGKYDDIIHLPHHCSRKRKHMSMQDRAAQFSPFDALSAISGYHKTDERDMALANNFYIIPDNKSALQEERT